MKIIRNLFLVLCVLFFVSCSSSDEDNSIPGEDNSMDNIFAMTAKINGDNFLANSAFGDNNFSSTNIFNYYPLEDYVMLQGRVNLNFSKEINIWLRRSSIAVGTYEINQELFDSNTGYVTNLFFISYGDITNSGTENTVGGTITITDVDTSSKIVTGTFELEVSVVEYNVPTFAINITEGTFRYVYEE